MKQEKIVLSKREEELMEMLWKIGRPMTTHEMTVEPWDRTWKDSYLKIMIRSLQEKGMIRVAGIKPHATIYARQFEPALSKEQYMARLIGSSVEKEKMPSVILALVKETKMDEESLDRLRAMIEEMRE